MDTVKENLGMIAVCIIELLIGIVLFTDPVQFTATVLMALGLVLLAAGAWCVIRYFTSLPSMAALGQDLTRGLVCLLAGALALFRNDWVISLFPLLTQIYGVVILCTGLMKLQRGVDLLRMRMRFWILPLISAALAIALCFLIFAAPFESTIALWRVAASVLIAQAALDLAMLVLSLSNRGQGPIIVE